MPLPKWHYRKLNGFAIGGWVFGYERRDYPVTVNIPVAWPTIYRDRERD
ncbi:hypothetical protein H7J07_06025 [Mycobacterium koreense]|nr:hypothetical protein [Mycolicibacillus koreensis]MCV7247784.1 hypothetical protein [Mycolicibacillus koreensis]BBY54169.1 hypothetical protein MKOR_14200 [Mycolicibacillus koreensis]